MSEQNIQNELERLRKELAQTTPGNPVCFGWKSYAQTDEDGIIRECLRRISTVAPLSKTFVEIGCGDGLENNTHQLLLEGFRGCWIEGNADHVNKIGEGLGRLLHDRLYVHKAFLSLNNVWPSLAECLNKIGLHGDIDFLSLDTDGNDIHFMRAILRSISPKLLCVEYNAKFPVPTRLEMEYRTEHVWAGDDYFGASLQSWVDTLDGYLLVSCNLSGTNAFFVRDDCSSAFQRFAPGELYQPLRLWLANSVGGHVPSLSWLKQELKTTTANSQLLANGQDKGTSRHLCTISLQDMPEFPFEVHTKTDQFISAEIVQRGIWEPYETAIFRKLCPRGAFVLDIGANIGWYSVVGSFAVEGDGRVMSFEPDPDNYELLRRNVARCSKANVETFRLAVGDTSKELKLYLSETNCGDHRVFADKSTRSELSVEGATLDTILLGNGRFPDLVKSDTQGSEVLILRGAKKLLQSGWRPAWLLEFWPFGLRNAGTDPVEMIATLERLGYQFFEVSEQDQRLTRALPQSLSARAISDLHPDTEMFINLLAIQPSSKLLAGLRDVI